MSRLGYTDLQFYNRIATQAQRADAATLKQQSQAAKTALTLQLKQQSADTQAALQAAQVATDTAVAAQQSDAKAIILRAVPWLIGGVIAIIAVAVLRKKR